MGVLVGLVLAAAGAALWWERLGPLPHVDDRAAGLVLVAVGLLVVATALLARWADPTPEDDALLRDRLLGPSFR